MPFSGEVEYLSQSPNHLTKSQNPERIIIDAEITQIETTAAPLENKPWNLPEVSPLIKTEHPTNLPNKFENRSPSTFTIKNYKTAAIVNPILTKKFDFIITTSIQI